MTYKAFAKIIIAFLLLAGLSLGGLDQSGSISAKNLTISDFDALVPESDVNSAVADNAPLMTSADPGTELATYTEQAPPATDLGKLIPSTVLNDPPMYMYHNGDYLAWKDFSAIFPSSHPGLWIERAVSWTMYSTLPLGGWARELIYVPSASSIVMYEIYPSSFVKGYNLGFANPGYYYIWYYADTPGRHRSILATSSGYSNPVTVDVYLMPIRTKPNPSTPKEECEKKPYCRWVNGQCLCTMPPISEKEKCLQNPDCAWVNGQCLCTIPDPEKEQCEKNPLCDWVDGHCYCRGDIDPEKESCIENPDCSWANNKCLCRGLNPPDPMPEPVPNPNPEPEPDPFIPAPNPVAQCESNPDCNWANGRCDCTDSRASSSSDNYEDSSATGDLGGAN